jgi:transcriptional regulator with XRE-family HTH domain
MIEPCVVQGTCPIHYVPFLFLDNIAKFAYMAQPSSPNSGGAMTPLDAAVLPARSRPLPVPHPRRATPLDWGRIVELLAQGVSTLDVAQRVGCSRQTVWKVLRRSRALEEALDDAESELGVNARLRLRGLRPLADSLAAEVDKGNVRVILWLADRLHLADDRPWRRTARDRAEEEPLEAASVARLRRSLDARISPDNVDEALESTASALTVNEQR